MNTKVRRVICPRCWQVLEEIAEVPLYKCGGCDTILRAKIRKNETKDAGSPLHEADCSPRNERHHVSEDTGASGLNGRVSLPSTEEPSPNKTSETNQYKAGCAHKNEPDHVSEDKEEASRLAERVSLPCKGEYSPDKTNESNQYEFGDCNREQPEGRNLSDELPSSSELICHENEDLSPEVRGIVELDEDICPLDQYNSRDINGSGDIHGEWTEGRTFPNLLRISAASPENGESSAEARAHVELDEDECPLDLYSRRCRNEIGDGYGEGTGSRKFSARVFSSTEPNHQGLSSTGAGVQIDLDESKYSFDHKNGWDQNKQKDCSREEPRNMNGSKEVSSSTQPTCHEIDEQFSVAEMAVGGEGVEVNEDFKSCSNFRSSSAENLLAMEPKDSLNDSHLSDDLTSPKKQMKQSQKSILHGFDRESSVDALENLTLVKPRAKVSAKLYISPTRRYYGNDGSPSSFYGTGDKLPDRRVHLYKRNSEEDLVSTNEFFRRNEFRVNDGMGTGLEIHHQAMNPSSMTSEKKHHAMKSTNWRQDELPMRRRHNHPFRGKMRDEDPYRMPFYSTGSPSGHGNGSPSRHMHKEFKNQSSYHSPEKHGYLEPDKTELLRLVYELNRTDISKTKANRRFPVDRIEKQIPSYYDHFASVGDTSRELNYPVYPGRHAQGKYLPERCKISRMALSGEATHRRHQIDCFCVHCCPREWRSEQLPRNILCCNEGRTSHSSHNHNNPYISSPSSPQHYKGSEISSWSHDIMFDDQSHRDRKRKTLYRREKDHLIKQHFRPVAGGAPVIACYHCLKLLQLPADFLLFRRKCHRLKCSACSKVLTFSLQKRSHLVPYNPESHANDCLHIESVSYSDNYGPSSFCKNDSTESDHLSIHPLHALERNSNDRKMSSGSSFKPMEEKNKSAPKALKKYKNHVVESAGPLFNMSSRGKLPLEIEEVQPTRCSPLHRLMGYSSPSKVMIKGLGD